jgi:hypothetical protein
MLYVIGEREADGVRCPVFALHDEMHFGAGLAQEDEPEWAEHEPEFDLVFHSGLRRGSMYLDLTWENVDLKNRIAVITRTKNGASVVVPLTADAMRALAIFRSRGDGTGRVVRKHGGRNSERECPLVRAGRAPSRNHEFPLA